MDFIKNLSFTLALFLVGALFLLLGILGGFHFGEYYNVVVQNNWARIGLLVVGAAFVGLAIYIELKLKGAPKNTPTEPNAHAAVTVEKICADNFFYTLDDQAAANFASLTAGAHRISILSRTAVNLLSQYQKIFEQLGSSGCSLRLLFIDPNCEAARYVYGNATDVYLNNVKITSAHLKTLRGKIGANLQARTTKHAPTLSIIIIEKQPVGESYIRVQLYFLHSCVGRDRPIFKVNHSEKWYDIFVAEFNQIWAAGDDWDDSSLTRSSLTKKI
jgi:hypothetical protein